MTKEEMTNEISVEEAIEVFKFMKRDVLEESKEDKVLDMAIKALEQQPSEDAISREAVIRLVEQYPNIIGNRCSGLIADIKHLPPITPSYNSIKTELDCIIREDALKAMCDKCPMYNCVTGCSSYRHIEKMPSVTPSYNSIKTELDHVIDEIIIRIEQTRDKDKLCEYPYNRCIKIIREVLGDD